MRLTKLEPLPGDRFSLTLEDGSVLRCGPREVLDFGLRSGLDLEGETLERLREACAAWAVFRKAAALLAARAMSAGELKQKLTERGAEPRLAEKAVQRLLELGAIDESAYAESVVRHYAAKGYGKRRIEQELYRHKLPRALWAEALETLPDTRDTLDALVKKRLAAAPTDRAGLKKLADSLLRRGYGWEEVRAAIARNVAQEDNDFGD